MAMRLEATVDSGRGFSQRTSEGNSEDTEACHDARSNQATGPGSVIENFTTHCFQAAERAFLTENI